MATYTRTIPDDVTPLLMLVPNAVISKLQKAFAGPEQSEATPAQTKERVVDLLKNTIKYRLQDIDQREFNANREQYNDITGE